MIQMIALSYTNKP